MGFLGLLLFSCGIFGISCGCKCVAETAKCSQYWAKIETYKDLMESERELDAWCREQPRFYECLEGVLLADKNGNMSYLPTNLLISKLFSEDLCTDGSTSRRRYLNNAACINQLNTEFCTESEYLDIVTPDDAIPTSRCSLSEKTFSCIAATMVLNCGFDAGRVYRNLLKITRYSEEVCGVETSQGIPPCEKSGSETQEVEREQKISEIYYGLVHKIGDIPEQETDRADPIMSNELSESEEPADEIVTEAITIALESLDQNALFEEHVIEPGESKLISEATEESTSATKLYKPYMKYPIITQIYRDIIFYNYSSLEYAFYWRQPDFTIFENVTCEHLQPSYMRGIIFRCVIEYRTRDPDCVSNATVHEPVTPELIRDIDPEVPDDSIVEFGPRPDWMKDMDDAYEEKKLRDLMKSTTVSSDSPVTDNPVFTTSSTLLHIAEAVTKPPEPEWWEVTHTMLLPDDIKAELMELLMPEPEKYVPPPMNMFQIGNCMYIFIYDPLTNSVENFTCSRLNECHPRGKGVFKCSSMRRKIETCDVCYGGTGANIEGLPVTWPSHPEYAKPAFKVSDTTDPTPEPESSGFSELTPAEEELIALVFSDVKSETEASVDNEQVSDKVDDHESAYVDEESELQLIMRSANTEENSEELEEMESEVAEEDSSVRLVIMDQNSLEERGGYSYIPELVYEIGEMEVLDNDKESEFTVSPDGDYGLLNENVIVLHSLPSMDDEESQYAIVN